MHYTQYELNPSSSLCSHYALPLCAPIMRSHYARPGEAGRTSIFQSVIPLCAPIMRAPGLAKQKPAVHPSSSLCSHFALPFCARIL